MVQIQGLDRFLREQPIFADLDEESIAFLAGCASNQVFEAGELIFRDGDPADRFHLIRHGNVAVQISVPPRPPLTVQTLHEGDILGWSWLVPPHRSNFDARALTLVRAIAIDATCLRTKLDQNRDLGYRVFYRFTTIMAELLSATRMQLMDVYAQPKEINR